MKDGIPGANGRRARKPAGQGCPGRNRTAGMSVLLLVDCVVAVIECFAAAKWRQSSGSWHILYRGLTFAMQYTVNPNPNTNMIPCSPECLI